MSKVIVKVCVCGKHLRRDDQTWQSPSKLVCESLKDYVAKGIVEIERKLCPAGIIYLKIIIQR